MFPEEAKNLGGVIAAIRIYGERTAKPVTVSIPYGNSATARTFVTLKEVNKKLSYRKQNALSAL